MSTTLSWFIAWLRLELHKVVWTTCLIIVQRPQFLLLCGCGIAYILGMCLFVHHGEGEYFAAAVTGKISTTKDHEAIFS